MATIPAPTSSSPQEVWTDADFDLPEGDGLHASDNLFDKDDTEDWDVEMNLGKTGGAKAKAVLAGMAARSLSAHGHMVTIRPPLIDQDDDDEGASTIKLSAFPRDISKTSSMPVDEDLEDAFALPSDLTQLSLAPLSLSHRASKLFEWGDRDHTSSSQSSDAYSSLSLADASPLSNSATSESLPCSEAEEDEDVLDGLLVPPGLFESPQGGRHLATILENRKTAPVPDVTPRVTSSDPEENFEIGLVINDDVDLTVGRLHHTQKQQVFRATKRSDSLPSRSVLIPRPPSRAKIVRAKSPSHPPLSSTRQFQKLRLSPSPPLRPIRSQTFQALTPPSATANPPTANPPRASSLRTQKSQPGFKPPNPSSVQCRFVRKASLSSLEAGRQPATSGQGASNSLSKSKGTRYDAPTAASRAKSQSSSVSRLSLGEVVLPTTRSSSPPSYSAALRLSLPMSASRHKSRPSLASIFPAAAKAARATSPISLSPSSSLSSRSRRITPPINLAPVPKFLRKPKRQRMYGDGTELDGIEDLPTDREKERRYRVQPKGYGNRVPGGSHSAKAVEQGTACRERKKSLSASGVDFESVHAPVAQSLVSNTAKKTGRVAFPSKDAEADTSKKKKAAQPARPVRKPTLIRNLGGSNAPKVVGDMKWNPKTLRWEGNEHVLRDFDAAVGTSTRPALITHLSGSSLGSTVGSLAAGARKVGNMMFDPVQMCWISTLLPEEDEPDVFANLADDEEDGWEMKGGTIRARLTPLSATPDPSLSTGSTSSLQFALSPAPSHSRTMSESSNSERGSRPFIMCDVDEEFKAKCRLAEHRHRAEMKGWLLKPVAGVKSSIRPQLYEIRSLATRKY